MNTICTVIRCRFVGDSVHKFKIEVTEAEDLTQFTTMMR